MHKILSPFEMKNVPIKLNFLKICHLLLKNGENTDILVIGQNHERVK